MRRAVLLALLLVALPVASLRAQGTGSIAGRITDDAGKPLSGMQVSVVGTRLGVLSNAEGRYAIAGVTPGSVDVRVTALGYTTAQKTVTVRAGEVARADFSLTTEAVGLQALVVVGYGTQRKETVTGSVAKVSGLEIAKSPAPNVVTSMAGQLPGLVVNTRTGDPGRENLSILIRGTGTFRNASPLVIVDGVDRGGDFTRLDPEDIESISVLKDASAAIYGARAANGVILVTTKRGTAGKARYSLSYNAAFSKPTSIPDMLDAATFAQVFNEADFYRKGRPANYAPVYTDQVIQKFRDGSDPVLYPNTDWVGLVLKPHATVQKLNLQASGGNDAVRYLLSFGALNQPGNFNHDPTHYRQYDVRTRVDANLSDRLSVGANLSGLFNNRTYPTINNTTNFINILQANPTLVGVYPNGLFGPGRLGENPLVLDTRGQQTISATPLFATFTANYRVPGINGLTLDASYNYDMNNQFQKDYNKPYYYYEYNTQTQQYDKKQGTGASTVEVTDTYNKWTTQLYNLRATFTRTLFEDHNISLMLGAERQKNTNSWAQAYRKNFVSPAIPQINAGSSDPADKNNGGSASAGAYNNYLGRVNYDFRNKYLAQFLFRYDGSQIFAPGHRYGFFPAVSAGWRLSQEKFIKDRFPFINELKLRGSYGELGNDRVGQYQYLQAFSFGQNYVFGTTDAPGIYANTMPNPNITWEVSRKTDAGLEANLWNGKLGLDLTAFKENRSKILTQANLAVPRAFGFPSLPDQNIGKVNNHGYELTVSHQNRLGRDLSYNLSWNLAYAKSKIVFLDEVPPKYAYQAATGKPVGSGLIYKADGIFHTQDELNSYPHGSGAQVGDLRIVDLNGDGKIDSQDQFRTDDSSVPQYVSGLTLGGRYKAFDMTLFFQGQTGAHIYDNTAQQMGGTDFANATVHRATNRWSPTNPNGTMPRADNWAPGGSTFWRYDATFARLKTAELGFTLPQRLTARFGTESARLYVSGFNVFTWAKELKWADPELAGDFTQYPPLRTLNLGANVSF